MLYANACGSGNNWLKFFAPDGDPEVAVVAIAEIWLTKTDYMPGATRQSPRTCLQKRKNECEGVE